MQFSILLAALAATTALAAPSPSGEVVVLLSEPAQELGSQTTLPAGHRAEKGPVGSDGPYQTVELKVGANVNPNYRCQVLDDKNKPITLKRGASVSQTFGDNGKGPWTFLNGDSDVKKIICDPRFVKKRDANNDIRVTLSDPVQDLATQTTLAEGRRDEEPPVGSSGPFLTVELTLGPDVEDKNYRCQVLDLNKKPIVVKRGNAVDVTFGDNNKGEWTFKNGETEVSEIICDPSFKKGSA